MARLSPADDRNSDPAFVAYYERESVSVRPRDRFRVVRDKMLRLREGFGGTRRPLEVLNVGCGAGTECQIWAELGHKVTGIDSSEPLVQLARRRASEQDFDIHFDIGSALALPYGNNTFNVCLIPELPEHVPDWRKCLDEGARVLRAGSLIYISTTNVICPVQNKFTLPLYSWHPNFVKRRCEKLAVTTHRDWVSHTAYPAIHWFTFWQLKEFFATKSVTCFDRFDLARGDGASKIRKVAFQLIRQLPPLRVAAYLRVAATTLAGVKTPDAATKR